MRVPLRLASVSVIVIALAGCGGGSKRTVDGAPHHDGALADGPSSIDAPTGTDATQAIDARPGTPDARPTNDGGGPPPPPFGDGGGPPPPPFGDGGSAGVCHGESDCTGGDCCRKFSDPSGMCIPGGTCDGSGVRLCYDIDGECKPGETCCFGLPGPGVGDGYCTTGPCPL